MPKINGKAQSVSEWHPIRKILHQNPLFGKPIWRLANPVYLENAVLNDMCIFVDYI